MTKGVCLNSQQLRTKILDGSISVAETRLLNSEGRFANENLEKRIQPASLEPTVGNEVFVLDTESKGMFRQKADETIYRTLLKLPRRQRQSADITNGFELKKGYTYLLPLEERISLGKDEIVKSSPKSSFGRLFVNSRLLADYNPCFDEIHGQYKPNELLQQWLMVQPLAFNMVIYPGVTLNQLRIFRGHDAQLSQSEIAEEFSKNPLLHIMNEKNELIPAPSVVTDGLQVHLDLSGRHTEGIVGLRARQNPNPIDTKKNEYDTEEFFEPLKITDGQFKIQRGEYYLLSTKERLKIPRHLNAELKPSSHIGLTGQMHFAGFIDNGFEGDLVCEVRSDELTGMELTDGMPVSKLDVFRTEIPDKLYGTGINSNYQNQSGPRPSKFFKGVDYKEIAKEYKKTNRKVLVADAKILKSRRINREGFEFITPEQARSLNEDVGNGFLHFRYDCEKDESVLQPIPYVVLMDNKGNVFSYLRADNLKDYGDTRLFGKHSIGLGGHISASDGPDYLRTCLDREVTKEEVRIKGTYSEPVLVGTLMAYTKPVDRVHYGMIYRIEVDGTVESAESSIKDGKMLSIEDLLAGKTDHQRPGNETETWSKILLPRLGEIYAFGRKN